MLHLKECALLYFATLIAFQDAATNVVKYSLDILTVKI